DGFNVLFKPKNHRLGLSYGNNLCAQGLSKMDTEAKVENYFFFLLESKKFGICECDYVDCFDHHFGKNYKTHENFKGDPRLPLCVYKQNLSEPENSLGVKRKLDN